MKAERQANALAEINGTELGECHRLSTPLRILFVFYLRYQSLDTETVL